MTGVAIPQPTFAEYSEQYKDYIAMERRNGVIMLRLHTENKAAVWGPQLHRAFHQAVQLVGNDPENELMILTATGDFWIAYRSDSQEPPVSTSEDSLETRSSVSMDRFIGDGIPVQENIVNLRIPTIAAITGPGYHMELGLFCDITICTEDTVMIDSHRWKGFVSGDGVNIAMQANMGEKRANYHMLLGTPVSAQQALDWGVVNEVVSRDRIYDRAWELAEEVMRGGEKRRAYRRMMTELMRKPLKKRMAEDFIGAFAMEMYGYMADSDISFDEDAIAAMWAAAGVDVPEW